MPCAVSPKANGAFRAPPPEWGWIDPKGWSGIRDRASRPRGRSMSLRASRLLFGVWVVAGPAFPAMAQQSPPPAPPQHGLLCGAFTKAGNGDWVAKKDVMVPGPGGMALVKQGVPVDDETQERL